jgi:very-short-patch-repair endonuclease
VWLRVAHIAEAQYGLITRDQLREAGLSDAAIGRVVAAKRIFPLFPTVFAVGHRGVGWKGRLLGAALACGEGSVVSHGTAAALLGLWEFRPDRIDVIAPVESGRKIAGVKRRFVPMPSPDERTLHEGVPTTIPSRTVIDVAGLAGERLLRRTIEQAAVIGVLSVPEIDHILAASPPRRGSRRLLQILEDWRRYEPGIKIRSRMEARLLPLLTRARLPIPECNAKLRAGGETFEIDLLWREQRVAVEADGAQFHDNPPAGKRDSRRNRALAAAGFVVHRLGWEDLRDRPEAVMAELARLLIPRRSS